MWIAFVLCLSYICHSLSDEHNADKDVVNCFCSLFIIYLSQLHDRTYYSGNSCELLLFFVYHIFVTAKVKITPLLLTLWIAFVLCLSYICHSFVNFLNGYIQVVNCFCSLFIIYLSQQLIISMFWFPCCELLLFFVYHIFVTAWSRRACSSSWLWIAFVLCLSYICHSPDPAEPVVAPVVNCFCSLFIIYLSQHDGYF